jgi:hypothetical protein
MTNYLQTGELTKEEILDLADAEGKKLGYLLATSPLDNETKKALLNIIEKATLEQIDAILRFFEEGYLMANDNELNDWFKKELEKIRDESDEEQNKVDEKTIKKIEALEKSL